MEYKSQKSVAGVDEVGRGSLIGPVYAAAVVFKEGEKPWINHLILTKKINY